MNRLLGIVAIGAIGVGLIVGCDGGDDEDDGLLDTATSTSTTDLTTTATTTATSTATESPTDEATETATEEATDLEVSIADGAMTVDGTAIMAQEVAVGTTVIFMNDGDAAVALASDDGSIDTEIAAGESYEHTFDEAGEWTITVDGAGAVTFTAA